MTVTGKTNLKRKKTEDTTAIQFNSYGFSGYFIYGVLEQYGRFSSAIIHYTELAAFFDQTEKEVRIMLEISVECYILILMIRNPN